MEYGEIRPKFRVKAPDDTASRVAGFLRKAHPRKTSDEVSARTGISAKTVATWLEGASVPGGLALIALTSAYGPEFLCSVMTTPPRWLDEAHRSEQARHLQAEIDDCRARLQALGS